MAAVEASCRKVLVNARRAILPLSCRGSISDILGNFQSGGALSGQRALGIKCSLMSGCGQGHKFVKDMWKKLWLKFPGLTHSRSRNTGEKGVTSLNKFSRKQNSVAKWLKSLGVQHIKLHKPLSCLALNMQHIALAHLGV